MAKKMLIDATHPEETRVVVVDGSRVEEFDFESLNKRQLAGNIYLAKVTRVEPSLQAAFVDYGGNRHGFLAFSEIHPDYYQIPVADREALLAAEAAAEAEAVEEDEQDESESGKKGSSRKRRSRSRSRRRKKKGANEIEASAESETEFSSEDEASADDQPAPETEAAAEDAGADSETASADEVVVAEPAAEDAASEPDQDAADIEATAEESVAVDAAVADAPDAAEESPQDEDASEDESEDDANGSPRSIAEDTGTEKDATLTADAPEEDADAPSGEYDESPDSLEAASDEAETDRVSDDEDDGDDGEDDEDDDSDDEDDEASDEEEPIESVGADDVEEEVRPRRRPVRRYKIQEVIKRRQILLVQVVKEERGNKGAALTTYISIAGRYCVLMPNTARGGGISRKITNATDRKRLKEIANGLDVPKGMGLIVRTAGAERTKSEIKRDYDFLLRQWDLVRDMTLKSVAPTLIYEEGSLIKRSIRDLYSKEITAVLVEGEAGYREAKDYMKMLMPSHAKNVQPYRDQTPLFIRHQVEAYLNSMFNPVVQLRSGGYIVIGVTEALVAIDVNSGRATKESSIENTALKTNLEAADEVARQLRLRDLAGLIVIDFIDMEESKNNRAVEKRFKERLKHDRARLQVGRISGFGLLEMSRQRLRPGMLEATTAPCPHCHGQGIVRSEDSLALSILRQLEEEGVKRRSSGLKVVAPVPVANYIVNKKRDNILQIESRYGVRVEVEGEASRIGTEFIIERTNAERPENAPTIEAVTAAPELMDVEDEAEEETAETSAPTEEAEDRSEGGGKKRRRRRGRRGGRRKTAQQSDGETSDEDDSTDDGDDSDDTAEDVSETVKAADVERLAVTEDGPFGLSVEAASESSIEVAPPLSADAKADSEAPAASETAADDADGATPEASAEAEDQAEAETEIQAEAVESEPDIEDEPSAEEEVEEEVTPEPVESAPPEPKRTGWWNIGRG